MDSQGNVLENIAKLQEEYYQTNQKNIFFKKKPENRMCEYYRENDR